MKRKPSKPEPRKPAASAIQKKSLVEKLEIWMEGKANILLIAALLLSLVFSFLLFDVKMSEGNDDSEYIEGAFKFSKDITSFFSSKAPLYPIVLSLPVILFGINVILLKSLSIVFHLLQIYFLFKAFHRIVPYTLLFGILFFLSLNDYFQYFASQTYSEAFFLFLQSYFLFTFRKIYDRDFSTNKENIKLWLLAGFALFLLTISRNIAIAVLPAVFLFFIAIKKFRSLIYLCVSFILFRGLFEIIKGMIWPGNNQFRSQIDILRKKDPYDESKGIDDLSGFFDRLITNTDIYLSKRLYQILGFISENSTQTKSALTFFTILLFALGIFIAFRKKNRFMIFISLYAFFFCGLTFFVLQTRWDQPRFVMICSHFILLTVFYGLYEVFGKNKALKFTFCIVPLSIILLSSFISSSIKSVKNFPILQNNLKGDIYNGYTPDWQNFLKMSKFCADSLPADAYVASRKAPMSFIYSKGKYFYPVYSVFSNDPDTILNTFQRDKVTHIILASLRRNPAKQDGYVINTMHRLMQPIAEKYPQKIKFIKQIGDAEPTYLYEFAY